MVQLPKLDWKSMNEITRVDNRIRTSVRIGGLVDTAVRESGSGMRADSLLNIIRKPDKNPRLPTTFDRTGSAPAPTAKRRNASYF